MAEKIMGIYYIRNVTTEQMYIGSSVYIDRRIKRHFLALVKGDHHSVYLQRAWDKYGPASFDYGIAEVVEDRGLLQSREQEWIDIFGVYNVSKFADRPQPPEMTEDVRRRISEALKGRIGTMTGKTHTDDVIAKMRTQRKGVKRPHTGAAISAGKTGSRLTDATKDKLRSAARDRWADPSKRKSFLDNFQSLKMKGVGPWTHQPDRKPRVRLVKHDAHVKLFERHTRKMAESSKYRKSYVLKTQEHLPLHDAHVRHWHQHNRAEAGSRSMSNNWANPEFIQKAKQSQVGVKRTDAQKLAISLANKGRVWTEERRERYKQTMLRPEMREKAASGRRNKPWTPEMREKILSARAATNAMKKAANSALLEAA